MILSCEIAGKKYNVDTSHPLDISIPLLFNGEQPSTYGVEMASSNAYEGSGFIGDTMRGGSCNFDKISLVPHCNGTHTECVGHISYDRIYVNNILSDFVFPGVVISIEPDSANYTDETYIPDKNADDFLIAKKQLEKKLKKFPKGQFQAIIIRTMPNPAEKKKRDYMGEPAPFFSLEAIEFIKNTGCMHLLVDFPSLDRAFDDGKLSAHHIYWDVEQGSHKISQENCSLKTVTEMVFVPDIIVDGLYLVNLHLAPFSGDAAPSRPVLYELFA